MNVNAEAINVIGKTIKAVVTIALKYSFESDIEDIQFNLMTNVKTTKCIKYIE